MEASSEGGIIVIDISHDEDHVRIGVSEQGSDIAPDALPHICEPFVSGMQKRTQGGLGLGLSISSSLVKGMGRKIEVVSILSKGSTFTVLLSPARMTHPGTHSEGQTK